MAPRQISQRQYFFGSRARLLYELIGWNFRKADHLRFMNYGYDDGDPPPLAPEDEAERYCAQLYHAAAALHDLSGKHVLDIGSGRGGGAAHVHRYFAPLETVGCDLAQAAIRFCESTYRDIEGLRFVRGNATDLPFKDNAFGAVLNVESAHCYPDRDAFFAEVFRVLAPGGTFHFSDFTRPGRDPAAEIAELTAALKEAGLTVATERDITDAILHGLDHDDARRRREIRRWFPLGTRRLAALWTGTRGSWIYEDFRAGRRKYVMVLAFKPAGSGNAALLAPACKAGHHHEPALTL